MTEPDPKPPDSPPDLVWQDTVELVERAQEGDEAAFTDVLARYYPRVLGIVRTRLGGHLRRFVESGDLVQEAMGEAVGAFDRFDMRSEEALIRWLSKLVENRIRDLAKFYRAEKRIAAREVPLDSPLDSQAPAFDPAESTLSPLERVARVEMSERVRARVQELPDRYREVVERRGSGTSWAAVAQAMGLETAGAARMLHARAKVALMKALAADEED